MAPTKKIVKVDQSACKTISAEALKELKKVATELGLTVKEVRGKYDPEIGKFTWTVEFAVEGSAAKEWEMMLPFLCDNSYGEFAGYLTASDFGKVVLINGKQIRLKAIVGRRSKFPILGTDILTGKSYKYPEDAVRRALQAVKK